jgi:hypothetical protein
MSEPEESEGGGSETWRRKRPPPRDSAEESHETEGIDGPGDVAKKEVSSESFSFDWSMDRFGGRWRNARAAAVRSAMNEL